METPSRIMARIRARYDRIGLHVSCAPLYTWSGFSEPMPKKSSAKTSLPVQPVSNRQFASYPSLRNRAVLVTGGATGIGESIVRHFARQGSRVAFLDIQDEAAEKLLKQLAVEGCPKPLYLHCDLTDIPALQSAVKRILAEFGGLDVLVNNAANDKRHSIEEVTPEFWNRGMEQNLRHHFFCAQAVVPAMRAQGRGAIINMSSISYLIPSTGLPVYVTAKAAIVGLTRTLAHELGAAGIRVNAVLPGAIATEKQKRLVYTPQYKKAILAGQALQCEIVPDDVARLVLFLAADDSSAITNQSYIIDGGWA